MLNSDGSGRSWVKTLNGKDVEVGANGVAVLTVKDGTTTLTSNLSSSADLDVGGGRTHDYTFYKVRVLQSTTPVMTSSYISGARDKEDSFIVTRVPLLGAGSVLGLALLTQDATVKSGSLSGTVRISGTPSATATVGIATGTIATARYAKDAVTFTQGQYLEVQLTASSGYLTDTDPNSGSWIAVVSVEY